MPAASIEEIHAEAQLADQLIKRTTERIDSSEPDVKEFLNLEFCRAEQRAYLSGLLYALGYPTMLDRLEFLSELDLCDRTDINIDAPGVRNTKV
jgi:hypothetical protein